MLTTAYAETYRKRAIVCERRAKGSSDPGVKREWNELAEEWHTMATVVALIIEAMPQKEE